MEGLLLLWWEEMGFEEGVLERVVGYSAWLMQWECVFSARLSQQRVCSVRLSRFQQVVLA